MSQQTFGNIGQDSAATTTVLADICAVLVDGADADIWYDAVDHEGEGSPAARRIAATRETMTEAAELLPRLLDLLSAMKSQIDDLTKTAVVDADLQAALDASAKAEALIAEMNRPVTERRFDAEDEPAAPAP